MSNNIYRIAHLREQGQDMIIIPMASSINFKTETEQNDIKNSLQCFARDAGLAGTVCLVWNSGNRFNFMAPKAWHSFFRGLNMNVVSANINKTLTCQNV
jgi:hypothetical protein